MIIDTRESAPRPTAGTRHLRRLLAAAPAVLAVITLAACGNSGTSTASANPAPAASTGVGNGANGARQIPGVSGLVAAISGKTLQVQGENTQTAVTYNAKTTFTDTVTGSAADVKVGSCVMVQEPASTAAPTPQTNTPVTKVSADRVSITAAVKGSCERTGFPGGLGRRFGGNGTRPSGPPTATPLANGAPGAGGRAGGFPRFGGTSGKVTSVTSGGFVVESTGFGQSATTTSVAVTTSASTTFTTTVGSTSKAVATGTCVTALGKTDSTGALTATSISVRAAENGACTLGLRGARPNGGTNG
jgi:hypothetical protein